MIKIVDLVNFNDHWAYVLNKKFLLTYEKHGDLLIGSDETQTFFNVLYYSPCSGDPTFGGNYAFGGRKFDLLMKDGTITQCYGQYWAGEYSEAEKILGIKFSNCPYGTLDSLKKCYVFYNGIIDEIKLQTMIDKFFIANPNYKSWEYEDYKKHIEGVA